MIILDPLLVGAEIPFSIDMAPKMPEGVTLASAVATVLSGASSATVDRVSYNGTKVYFWVKALGIGVVVFNILATFSDTSDDGERVQVQVI